MTKIDISDETWVWVVVQDPGGNEMFLGQYDEVDDVSFIPAFGEKAEALECLEFLVKDEGMKYEVQAIRYGLLVRYASENGFMIFVLRGNGEVVQKMEKT